MSWFSKFLGSSIGRKLLMSLTGLFLISFLPVHLAGNLQLLAGDGGEAFNTYAEFMTTNPLIKFISYGLYFFILLHTFLGVRIWLRNRSAKGSKYAVSSTGTSSFSSRNMAWLGIIIFAFLVLHLYQFWLKMKMGVLEKVNVAGLDEPVNNLYAPVEAAFTDPIYVIIYVIAMIVIGFHLWHGFQSSFQTLGLNHKKYTPVIKGLGAIYSIVVPLGFIVIPIVFYLRHAM